MTTSAQIGLMSCINQPVGEQIFTSAGTFTVPSGVTQISLVCIDSGNNLSGASAVRLKRGSTVLCGNGASLQTVMSGGSGGSGKYCQGYNGSSTYNYYSVGGGGGAAGYYGNGGNGGDGEYLWDDGFGAPSYTPPTSGAAGSYDGKTGGDSGVFGGGTSILGPGGGGTLYGAGRSGVTYRTEDGGNGGSLYYPNTYIAVTPGESLTVEHPGGNGAMRIIWGPGRIYPGSPA